MGEFNSPWRPGKASKQRWQLSQILKKEGDFNRDKMYGMKLIQNMFILNMGKSQVKYGFLKITNLFLFITEFAATIQWEKFWIFVLFSFNPLP